MRHSINSSVSLLCALSLLAASSSRVPADESPLAERLIGYTEFRTDLPGGRHANVRTQRALLIRADGSKRKLIAAHLADDPNAWTQFADWSPDGKQAVVLRGWQHPENAKWEEEHKAFRRLAGMCALDSSLVDLSTGKTLNVTAVERVSHYNSMSFRPDGKKLLMTSLVNGVSKPFLMDLNGRNKRDVSGGGAASLMDTLRRPTAS